jgi:hypothetical protein
MPNKQFEKQSNKCSSPAPPQDPQEESNSVKMARLEHARTRALHTADLRTKNFNFFIVIAGALVAAYANFSHEYKGLMIGLFGAFVSAIFFGLDVRGRRVLDACLDALRSAEADLGVPIETKLDSSNRSWLTHHLFTVLFSSQWVWVVWS